MLAVLEVLVEMESTKVVPVQLGRKLESLEPGRKRPGSTGEKIASFERAPRRRQRKERSSFGGVRAEACNFSS